MHHPHTGVLWYERDRIEEHARCWGFYEHCCFCHPTVAHKPKRHHMLSKQRMWVRPPSLISFKMLSECRRRLLSDRRWLLFRRCVGAVVGSGSGDLACRQVNKLLLKTSPTHLVVKDTYCSFSLLSVYRLLFSRRYFIKLNTGRFTLYEEKNIWSF